MEAPYLSPCYCTNLRRSARVITESYDQILQPLGLTVAQYYLLINLSRLEPVNTTQFANYVGLERSTLVRNIRILQKNKWVEDLSDGTKHQFQLTKKGSLLLEQARLLWDEAQAAVADYMGSEDTAELIRLLRKLQKLKWQE